MLQLIVGRRQLLPQRPACMHAYMQNSAAAAVPSGSRIMVDAVQTWTPYLDALPVAHLPAPCTPVWYQHILIDTKDNPRGCAPAPAPPGRVDPSILRRHNRPLQTLGTAAHSQHTISRHQQFESAVLRALVQLYSKGLRASPSCPNLKSPEDPHPAVRCAGES